MNRVDGWMTDLAHSGTPIGNALVIAIVVVFVVLVARKLRGW